MLWLYESFFPAVWILFFLHWQIKAGILTGFLGTAIAISQMRGFIVFVLIFLVFWIKLRIEE